MPFPTITKMYEEVNFKKLTTIVGVGSHLLSPNAREITYNFAMGTVPTCSFTIDNPPPAYVVKDAAVQLFVGFNGQAAMVFNGTIESADPSESGFVVQCSGQSKKLDAPYKASISTTDGTDVSLLLASILDAANVFSYVIDLPPWTPGAVVPQPLVFSTFAEAVNKLAETFGSPFYEMPSGYIRVDVRDPIPAPTAFRTYFSGVLTDGSYAQPAAVAAVNVDAQPRIRQIRKELLSRDVRNKIIVRGAEVPGTGGGGEVIHTLLEETASGPSPWIPPVNGVDQFVELIYQNELIDTVPNMAAVALRLFNVWNRLYEHVSLTVDGDPEIFLGATVNVIDLGYSRVNSKYVVIGYSCNISGSGFSTTLDLQGGRSAGVTPALSPFAFFTWTNQNVPIHPAKDINANNDANKAPNAAKLRQFVPEGAQAPGDPPIGQNPATPGDDGQRVIVGFDGSASVDPDGRIESYAWLDDATPPHSGSGQRFTVTFNPNDVTTVNMTLTVTDNSGLTSSITQNVNVNTFGPSDGYGATDNTGTSQDTAAGGGDLNIPVIFVALGANGVAATIPGDGGSSFNVFPGFSYNPMCVVSAKYKETDGLIAIFGGNGVVYITTSYLAVAPSIVAFGPYGQAYDIVGDGGNFSMVTNNGAQSWVLRSSDWGQTWTVQGTLNSDLLMRLSGNLALGQKGVWLLGDDGTFTPFDPNQAGVGPWIAEPAWILVKDDALLFNDRLIPNVHNVDFDVSGLTQSPTGKILPLAHTFVKALDGSTSFHALTPLGHIWDGDLTNTWEDKSPASNGLTNAWDFVEEQDKVYLAASAEGISKTVNYGVKWVKLALRASGVLTIGDALVVGDTMNIGGKTYTFVDDMDADMDGEIGITASIDAAVNGTDGHNTPHTLVTAESGGDGIIIRAIVPGTAGDGIATTSSFTNVGNFFDASTLGARTARVGLVLVDQPAIDETMSLDGKVFTFKSAAAMDGQISIGAALADTQANIVAAINGTDGINTVHPTLTAQPFVANMCIIETKTVKAPGYFIPTAETFASPNNQFAAGSAIASELPQAYRLQADNVAQTRPSADLYGVTT